MVKKIFFLFFILLFYILFGAFITSNHRHLLPATCAAGFVLAYVLARRTSTEENSFIKIFLIYYLPFLVLLLLASIVEKSFLRSWLYFFFLPLSAFLGYRFQRKRNYSYVLLLLVAVTLAGYILQPNMLSYALNKEARKVVPFPKVAFSNEKKEAVYFERDKVVVLDFWTTTCGVCFKKFPDFEALYKKYQFNENVVFYSVNVPLPSDSLPKTYNLVKKLNYAFPTIYTSSLKEIKKTLNITGYPQLVILRNDTIYYKGSPYYEPYMLVHHIEDEIKRVLQ